MTNAMTEQEAKSKWCPFANVADRGNRPQIVRDARKFRRQRSLAFEVQTRCLGSGCMAWRWVEDVCRHKETGEFFNISAMNPDFSDHAKYERVPSRGYCGLAGATT